MKFIALAFLLLPSIAWAYCSEPRDRAPSCVDTFLDNKFKDQFEFESCKSDVKRYTREQEEYVKCVADQAAENTNKAIKKFNCKANGDMIC